MSSKLATDVHTLKQVNYYVDFTNNQPSFCRQRAEQPATGDLLAATSRRDATGSSRGHRQRRDRELRRCIGDSAALVGRYEFARRREQRDSVDRRRHDGCRQHASLPERQLVRHAEHRLLRRPIAEPLRHNATAVVPGDERQ